MNEYTPQFLEICAINTNRNWDLINAFTICDNESGKSEFMENMNENI